MGAPRRMTLLLAAALAAAAVAGCGSNGAAPAPASQGNPAGAPRPSPEGPPPVITSAAARTALAGFAAAVTQADQLRDNDLLAAAETGTSYRIDAGVYRWTRVSDPGNRAYQALTVSRSAIYIPRRSGGQPWWVATAAWTEPRKPSAHPVPSYLLFTQVSGRWVLTLEPSMITGATATPAVVTDAAGYAATATPRDKAQLAIDPAQLPAVTAKYLNAISDVGPRCPRPGFCLHAPHGKIKISSPGRLSDIHDQVFFGRRFTGSDLDMHTVTQDPEFALRTAGGGALVFYDLRAELTLAPPAGFQFRVKIPGYYDGSALLTQATVVFFDQFATYDPPRGQGLPRVVADNAGPVSKD